MNLQRLLHDRVNIRFNLPASSFEDFVTGGERVIGAIFYAHTFQDERIQAWLKIAVSDTYFAKYMK